MKNRKIIMYIFIIIFILIILGVGYIVYKKSKNQDKNKYQEYIPQEEITDEQLRQTIITLYFMNVENGKIMPEARRIDAKKLNKIEIKNDCIYIDFSEDFIKEQKLGKEQEELIIKSIVNTVTELKEINSVVILIDGKENQQFPDGEINFKEAFKR